MPVDRRVGRERVNAFSVEERFLFKHYFDGEAVFDRLKQFYNNHQYRFEVPDDEFPDLASFLAEHGYDLRVVDDVAPFVVCVEQYTAHPDNIFKESVLQRSADGHNYFLMTDRVAVEQAVSDGAVRLAETDLTNPF